MLGWPTWSTAYDFPGRSVLAWALLLPLAVPTYIVAFAYLDLLHPIGPIQTALRTLLGYDSPRQFRLPDLRSLQGAIFVLGFVLYPYVYLTTRAMFLTQSASLLEAARTLGASRLQVFREVALPLARPAIAVGMSLALLETLNDSGRWQRGAGRRSTTERSRVLRPPQSTSTLRRRKAFAMTLTEESAMAAAASALPIPSACAPCSPTACMACQRPGRWCWAACRWCWALFCQRPTWSMNRSNA